MQGSTAESSSSETLRRIPVEQCETQIRRVVSSAAFRNASTSQALLQYLAKKTFSGEGDSLKEYTIGVEALGRKESFDPKLDPIVRVQSHRLRVRLRDYYDLEGAADPIRLQLPRGRYVLRFEPVDAVPAADAADVAPVEVLLPGAHSELAAASTAEAIDVAPVRRGRRRWLGPLLLALGAGVLVALGVLLGLRLKRQSPGLVNAAATVTPDAADRAVEAFWSRFAGADAHPVIGYTDAVFLLDDSNDLYRYRRGAIDSRGALVDPHLAREFASDPEIVAKAGKLYYENGYTGTGELESVGLLAGLLGRMGLRPVIKSSRDLTPEDLSQHNVILLGSPFQNTAVAQLLTSGDFVYENPDQHREQWRAQILNAHPRPGERPAYGTERDPMTQALKRDYSLITVVPGTTPGRLVAVLGGLDTKGTQGATLFATSRLGVQQMEAALRGAGQPSRTELPPFQALIQVNLAKGYQVLGADMVAVHLLPSTGKTGAGN